jgi:hypothetical protein
MLSKLYNSILKRLFVHVFFQRNPTKGIIINHPDGDDVYHGVPHDYTHLVISIDYFVCFF